MTAVHLRATRGTSAGTVKLNCGSNELPGITFNSEPKQRRLCKIIKHISWKTSWVKVPSARLRTFEMHVRAKNSVFVSSSAPSGRKTHLFHTHVRLKRGQRSCVCDTWWSSWRDEWCSGWFEPLSTPRVDIAEALDRHPCVLQSEDRPETHRAPAELTPHAFHIQRMSKLIWALKLHAHHNTRHRLTKANYTWGFSTGGCWVL